MSIYSLELLIFCFRDWVFLSVDIINIIKIFVGYFFKQNLIFQVLKTNQVNGGLLMCWTKIKM